MGLLSLLFTKEIIIYFIIGIVVYLVLYFISKTIFRIIMFLSTLLLIIILIVGFFAINDAIKFSNSLKENEAIFILDYNNNYIAGLKYNFNNNNYEIIKEKNLLENYKKIVEEKKEINNTLFIMNYSYLEKQNLTIKENPGLPEFLLEKNKILSILKSKNALEDYAKLYYKNNPQVQVKKEDEFVNYFVKQMKEQGYTNTKLKSEIFSFSLAILMEQDQGFLFKAIKEKNVKIYPERMFIKILDYIPQKQFEKALQFSTEKINETTI